MPGVSNIPMDRKCRDCRRLLPPQLFKDAVRRDVCGGCMDVRKRVVAAIEAGKMTHEDFTRYQRARNKIEALSNMGHYELAGLCPRCDGQRWAVVDGQCETCRSS